MIECRGVSFSYDGAVPALDGVDLNIEDGEFFCILGGLSLIHISEPTRPY